MQGKGRPGIIDSDDNQVITVEWNDLESFEKVLNDKSNEIACFISSPYDHPASKDNTLPEDGYWQGISSLCKKHNVILIIDDVRAGFRINLSGLI